jgi:hypothetical protein
MKCPTLAISRALYRSPKEFGEIVAAKPVSQAETLMTIRTRCALGTSAAVLSFSLALAPAAFAQDKMGKDDAMKKDDGMAKH